MRNSETYTAFARLLVYILAALTGAAVLIIGALRGEIELITLGGALLGTNTLAGLNIGTRPPENTQTGTFNTY